MSRLEQSVLSPRCGYCCKDQAITADILVQTHRLGMVWVPREGSFLC